ncbi:MAG: cell division protein MraZ [Frankiales bacterium]|nr:cell division protein MraZ [Frankiales bacterium]
MREREGDRDQTHGEGEAGLVFLGTHSPRLDDKGRLILPAKFRDQLAEGVVITKGQERCLFVFTAADFSEKAKAQHAPLNKKDRDAQRLLFSSAFDEVPDRTGRVTVPPGLRAYAGLTRDCVVTGVNDHLEIWDAETWRAYEAEQEQAYAELEEAPA